jgi:Tfp pilus assembly protein FimV
MNPNSSSLGVDVTFLLVGATAVALFTPIVGALIRMKRVKAPAPAAAAEPAPPAAPGDGEAGASVP